MDQDLAHLSQITAPLLSRLLSEWPIHSSEPGADCGNVLALPESPHNLTQANILYCVF